MNLFGSKELLFFCTSFSFLYGIWKWIGGMTGNHSWGVTPTHHYIHISWGRQSSGWGMSKQCAGVYVNRSMTVSLTWPWQRMHWWHHVMNRCVFSKWEILYHLKRGFFSPLTQTLWLCILISNVCQIYIWCFLYCIFCINI